MAAKFGIFVDEEHDSFPPKLHERPYKSRFIVTSSSCTTTELKKTFFMYARPLPVQTKVHFKYLQFLVVAYDMVFLKMCFRRCLNSSVFFPLYKQF